MLLLTAAGVWAMDNWTNSTVVKNAEAQVDWKALDESVGIASSIAVLPVAIVVGAASVGLPTIMYNVAALIFDIIALIVSWFPVFADSVGTAIIAVWSALLALVFTGLAEEKAPPGTGSKLFSALDIGLSVVALGSAFEGFGADL